MEEKEKIKKVTQVRIEFDDESWEIIDHQNLKHISQAVKDRLDFALFELETELEAKRQEALKKDSNNHLGIDVNDNVKSKDIGPGQRG